MLSFHFVVFFFNHPPLLLLECVAEHLVVFDVEGRTVNRKLNDFEIVGVFFERVNVCAGDDDGVVSKRPQPNAPNIRMSTP